jgi:hypothetical protein
MRALLDNATITAALRATGHIKVENRELFDLDVASLRILGSSAESVGRFQEMGA